MKVYRACQVMKTNCDRMKLLNYMYKHPPSVAAESHLSDVEVGGSYLVY